MPPSVVSDSRGVRLPAVRGATPVSPNSRQSGRHKTPLSGVRSLQGPSPLFVSRSRHSALSSPQTSPNRAMAKSRGILHLQTTQPPAAEMTFFEKTNYLYDTLEKGRQVVEMGTTKSLSVVIDDTADAKHTLNKALMELATEFAKIEKETTMFESFHATAMRLIKASNEIDDERDTYPGRNRPELATDGVSPAITKQCAEGHLTVKVMQEQLDIMYRSRDENLAMQAVVTQDMETKQRGLTADQTALRQKPAHYKEGDSTPRINLDHTSWVHNLNGLLDEVAACISKTSHYRQVAEDLRAQRFDIEVAAAWNVVDIMRDKQQHRRRQLRFLSRKVEGLREIDDELRRLYALIPGQQSELEASLYRAENRLAARNERPKSELKTDDAEDCLIAEVDELNTMLAELQKHKEHHEAEMRKSQEELTESEHQLREAEMSRDIDAACFKTEYYGSSLQGFHDNHGWLVSAVNYEYDSPILPAPKD